jgi:hypothetical protein
MALDENAAIARVRAVLDAYSRRDFDAVIAANDPEIEVIRAGGLQPVRGNDAIREWMAPDAFESQIVEPLEFRVSGDKVLVRQRNKIHGAGSGLEADFVSWSVWTLGDAGLVVRLELFQEEAEALKAAGMAESP